MIRILRRECGSWNTQRSMLVARTYPLPYLGRPNLWWASTNWPISEDQKDLNSREERRKKRHLSPRKSLWTWTSADAWTIEALVVLFTFTLVVASLSAFDNYLSYVSATYYGTAAQSSNTQLSSLGSNKVKSEGYSPPNTSEN